MNNNKELPFAYSAEDISRINAINLKDPHSVSALNAINISATENKTNPHDGSTLDSFLLEEAQNKIKQWEECAGDLVDYAREFVANLKDNGYNKYNRYAQDIKQAEDAIEEYLRLKNG